MSFYEIMLWVGGITTFGGVLTAIWAVLSVGSRRDYEKIPFRCCECGNINVFDSEELKLIGDSARILRLSEEYRSAKYPYHCSGCGKRTLQQVVSIPLMQTEKSTSKYLKVGLIVAVSGIVIALAGGVLLSAATPVSAQKAFDTAGGITRAITRLVHR